MRVLLLIFIVLLVLLAGIAHADGQGKPRQILNIDLDWRFLQSDAAGAESPDFDDKTWRRVDLPHDWSIEGEYNKDLPGETAYLPGGIGWYRREITVPKEWVGKKVTAEFDAASRNSEVWINGKHLGTRPYGYISFGHDLTPHLRQGLNVLAVRLDNSKLPSARWYTGSGIYAHVALVVTDKTHIPRWGTSVTTPEVSKDAAKVNAEVRVANDSEQARSVRIEAAVFDRQNREVASAEAPQKQINPGETTSFSLALDVKKPQLWSPEEPNIYRLVTRVLCQGELLDEHETRFGIRTLRWDASTGFWLNGKNTKLRGMCMHIEMGALGAALPDKVYEQRLRLLKDMGCNAIRCGHHPFPPFFYELCDRLGLMVVDEAFDGWHKKAEHDYGAEAFAEWWRRDLTDMVLRDRNHPSVILWSIGNETGKTDEFGMTKILHEMDPTRATTGGQVLFGVDVSGFNGPGETPGVLEAFHKEHPNQPIVLTEEPHGYQTRGFYRTLTWWRDNKPAERCPFPPYSDEEVFKFGGDPQYCSSYDNALVRITNRQCWKRTAETPWISGQFRWAAFDYLGEAHSYNRKWPARFWSPGVLDTVGFEKDIYYFYQSQWITKPMVYILPHWSHPLVPEGTKIPVVVYSNCDEVELFLNDKSFGRQKPRDLLDFVWQVSYKPGQLKAVGYRSGKPAATKVVRTAGPPAEIRLEVDHSELAADRQDVVTVTASIVDQRGEPVPSANCRIDFEHIGPARSLGYDNGDPTDVTPHRVGYRNAFAGWVRGFLRSTEDSGPVRLIAAGVLAENPFQTSTQVTLAAAQVALRGLLPQGPFTIHYTVDGSEPTASSPLYTKPFTVTESTLVRMLVTDKDGATVTSQAQLKKGPPVSFDDPRYEHPKRDDPPRLNQRLH